MLSIIHTYIHGSWGRQPTCGRTDFSGESSPRPNDASPRAHLGRSGTLHSALTMQYSALCTHNAVSACRFVQRKLGCPRVLGALSSVHVCVFVVESVRYYYLAVSHYTARVYCTSWHEAMRRTPPTLVRVSSESPANLAGVSSESLTTLSRVSSARSRSPCKHGDCSLLLPERLTRTLTPPGVRRSHARFWEIGDAELGG